MFNSNFLFLVVYITKASKLLLIPWQWYLFNSSVYSIISDRKYWGLENFASASCLAIRKLRLGSWYFEECIWDWALFRNFLNICNVLHTTWHIVGIQQDQHRITEFNKTSQNYINKFSSNDRLLRKFILMLNVVIINPHKDWCNHHHTQLVWVTKPWYLY